MTRSFHFLIKFMLPTLMSMASLATPVLDRDAAPASISIRNSPADGPCADQSLAQTVYQGFAGTFLAHVLHFHWAFVDYNSRQSAGPAFWTFQGPVFKAWPTQQTSTVPLFRMTTPTNSDFVFIVGTNAQTPPTKSGFATSTGDIVAWVYNTAVCGSVPLMSAVLAAQSDHYYTADPNEHTALLAAGWADGGVVAYVLPLSTS